MLKYTARKIILGSSTDPLIILESYPLRKSSLSLEKAYQELFSYEQSKAENQCTWGYFPGLEDKEEELYPETILLAKQLRNDFLAQLKSPVEKNLELAFVRMASKKPFSDFGGMHIDVDKGVGHKKDKKRPANTEILRLLINLSPEPRTLDYIESDVHQLREQGMHVSLDEYERIELSDKQSQRIDIPGITENTVHVLKFWSSLIPHVGITNEKGHFLAAYGDYADRSGHIL